MSSNGEYICAGDNKGYTYVFNQAKEQVCYFKAGNAAIWSVEIYKTWVKSIGRDNIAFFGSISDGKTKKQIEAPNGSAKINCQTMVGDLQLTGGDDACIRITKVNL